MKKVLSADVLSPILAYMRLDAPHKMILESIPREKENARFSIVAYQKFLLFGGLSPLKAELH